MGKTRMEGKEKMRRGSRVREKEGLEREGGKGKRS